MKTLNWVTLVVSFLHFGLRHELTNTKATLVLAEHVTNLYLHEIALHLSHGPAEFGPPFTSDSLPSPGMKKDVPIGPAHISALGECLSATHGMLDTILKIPLDVLLALPVIFCKSTSPII